MAFLKLPFCARVWSDGDVPADDLSDLISNNKQI